MNIQLTDVTITHRDGHITAAGQCFLRGSHIRFIILPDNLRHAPMFKNFQRRDRSRGMGMGKGRVEVARAQASKFKLHSWTALIFSFLVRGGKSGLGPQGRRP